MGRKVPVWFVLLIVWAFLGLLIIFSWVVKQSIYKERSGKRQNNFSKTILFIARIPGLVKLSTKQITSPGPLLVENRFPGIKGLKIKDSAFHENGYILLSGYNEKYKQFTVKLIRLADSKILNEWIPDVDRINLFIKSKLPLTEPYDKRIFYLRHPYLSSDGCIIIKDKGSLVKLDKNSKIKWVLNGVFHHSIESDEDGNIWVPYIIDSARVKNYFLKFIEDDAIAKVSEDGKLLFIKSVSEILIENGYFTFLFGIGYYEKNPVHLNDIQPALFSTKYWKKGDLLLSLRHRSTVLLYRPDENKIIWMKTGPWLNQHDADFVDSTRISVFGNDIIRAQKDFLIYGHNEVYIYDFSIDKISTPYTRLLVSSDVRTIQEGRCDILKNGDVFLEETNYGRLR